MNKPNRRTGLGRGLTALLNEQSTEQSGETGRGRLVNSVSEIPLRLIEANPYQPREDFHPAELDQLAESIRRHGVIQPITVRLTEDHRYQIISGERRTRASVRAGLEMIPAYVRDADDEGMVEMALIENIHREDLNAIEIAVSYQRLLEEIGLTQEELARKLGQNRTTITNYVRLLKLHPDVQTALRERQLSMGHARALLGLDLLDDQVLILKKILQEEWSVRKVEEQVRRLREKTEQDASKNAEPGPAPATPNARAWQHHFTSTFQKPVRIKTRKDGRGELIIPFDSEEELARWAQWAYPASDPSNSESTTHGTNSDPHSTI